MKKSAPILSSLVFLLGAGIIGASTNQNRSNCDLANTSITAFTPVDLGDDSATQPQQTFSGVVVSLNGARFVLRDDDANTWYHLDDQNAVKPYLGKKVVITGTLDARSDMIHVEKISES